MPKIAYPEDLICPCGYKADSRLGFDLHIIKCVKRCLDCGFFDCICYNEEV